MKNQARVCSMRYNPVESVEKPLQIPESLRFTPTF